MRRLKRDGGAQARDHAAKDDEHDLVAQKRGEVKDVEEQRREHDLHHREDDEALADAAPAKERHGDVEREHAERDVDMNAAERGDAIEQDRDAGEAARKQVGGANERLNQKCLENGGDGDRHGSNGAADDGETAEHEHAVRELIDGVRHVGSFRRQM